MAFISVDFPTPALAINHSSRSIQGLISLGITPRSEAELMIKPFIGSCYGRVHSVISIIHT